MPFSGISFFSVVFSQRSHYLVILSTYFLFSFWDLGAGGKGQSLSHVAAGIRCISVERGGALPAVSLVFPAGYPLRLGSNKPVGPASDCSATCYLCVQMQ